MTKAHFLLTNDDGISAKGLYHLWNGIKHLADVTIVAPDSQKSGTSQALTLEKTLKITPVDWEDNTPAYKVSGTPVDCVKLALRALHCKPTLILSGVNLGHNLGRTLLYSGTVGAIIEGVFSGIPGIAFSYFREDQDSYDHVEKYIGPIVEYLMDMSIPEGTFYNINFPEHLDQDIKGFKVAPHGRSAWEAIYTLEKSSSESHYTHGGQWIQHLSDKDTDCRYNKKGFITASPIKVAELTDFQLLQSQKQNFEKFIAKKFNFSP